MAGQPDLNQRRHQDANGTFRRRCEPLGDFHNGSLSVTYHELVKALILPEALSVDQKVSNLRGYALPRLTSDYPE